MKQNFKLHFNPQIAVDLQKTVDYYRRKTGNHKLGKRFIKIAKQEMRELKTTALHYQIRYNIVRFLPISDFPFVAHYSIDEKNKIVHIEALFHTAQENENIFN